MVTSDMDIKTMVTRIISPNDHKRLGCNSPVIKALVRRTTGVSGDTQLRFWTASGKEERGKNTPLKKNIGVINRVK